MELKKYFILIFFLNFTNFLHADIIKPVKNLSAYDVIKIQLNALKKNNEPNKNSGIKQTWVFAHPENKKITGPYKRFEKMLLGAQYNVLLNRGSVSKNTQYKNNPEWGGTHGRNQNSTPKLTRAKRILSSHLFCQILFLTRISMFQSKVSKYILTNQDFQNIFLYS